jgi:hypothetical protein
MLACAPWRVVLLVVGTLAALQGVARSAAPPENLLVSPNRTEPSVAVDPSHPSTVVVGSNPNYSQPIGGVYSDGYFASKNGAASFSGGTLPLPSGYVEGADPSVAIARSGTVFFSYLGESPAYCSSAGYSSVLLSTSTDHGRSFRMPTVVSVNKANDKPFMSVESIPGKKAHVFVTWTEFFNTTSRVLVARSVDGGETFGTPTPMFTSTWDNSGSVPLVGPNGKIYVMWSSVADRGISVTNPARMLYRVSADDGGHYGPVRQAGPRFTSIPRMTNPDDLRNLTLPAAAVTPSGTVYVAWAEVRSQYSPGSVSSDIVLTRSTNGGKTWARPRRVNDSRVHDRFMPSIALYSDGTVGVAFYDRRGGWGDLAVFATRVRWKKGPMAGPNVRITSHVAPVSGIFYVKPSSCLSPGRFFGDYIGVATGSHNSLYVAWADAQRRINMQTDIWIARVTLGIP